MLPVATTQPSTAPVPLAAKPLGATTTTSPGTLGGGSLGAGAATPKPAAAGATTSPMGAAPAAGGTTAKPQAYGMQDHFNMINSMRQGGNEAQAWGLYNSLTHGNTGGYAGGAQGAISAGWGAEDARKWVNDMYTKYGESGVDLKTGEFRGMGQANGQTSQIAGWDPSRYDANIAMAGGGWNPEAAARAQAQGTYTAPTAGWDDMKWGGYSGGQGPQFQGQNMPGTGGPDPLHPGTGGLDPAGAPPPQSPPAGGPPARTPGGPAAGMTKPALMEDDPGLTMPTRGAPPPQPMPLGAARGAPPPAALGGGSLSGSGSSPAGGAPPMQPNPQYQGGGMGPPPAMGGGAQYQGAGQMAPGAGYQGPPGMMQAQGGYGGGGGSSGSSGWQSSFAGPGGGPGYQYEIGKQGDIQRDIQGSQYYNEASQKAYMEQARRTLDPMWKQTEQDNESKLVNMGLSRGSEAWDREMANLSRNKNDAYTSATNSAILNAGAEGSRMQGMDLNQGNFHNQAQNQGWSQAMGQAGLRNNAQNMNDSNRLGQYNAWSSNQLGNRGQDTNAFAAYNNASLGNRGMTLQEQNQQYNMAQGMQRFPYELQNLAMQGMYPQGPPGYANYTTPGGGGGGGGGGYGNMMNQGIQNQYGGYGSMGGALISGGYGAYQAYNRGNPGGGYQFPPGQGPGGV